MVPLAFLANSDYRGPSSSSRRYDDREWVPPLLRAFLLSKRLTHLPLHPSSQRPTVLPISLARPRAGRLLVLAQVALACWPTGLLARRPRPTRRLASARGARRAPGRRRACQRQVVGRGLYILGPIHPLPEAIDVSDGPFQAIVFARNQPQNNIH